MTQHYKEHYRTLKLLNVGTLLTDGKNRYLLQPNNNEVIVIPFWVARSLLGDRQLTQQWGPYMMYNGYETTAEAKYLKDMFKYPMLTSRAQLKVNTILRDNKEWVEEDKEFKEVLSERETSLVKYHLNRSRIESTTKCCVNCNRNNESTVLQSD